MSRERPCPVCARNSSRPGVAIPHCSTCGGTGRAPVPEVRHACPAEACYVPRWLDRIAAEACRIGAPEVAIQRALNILRLTEWTDPEADGHPVPMPGVRVRGGRLELAWERDDRRLVLEFRPGTTRVRFVQRFGSHDVPGVLYTDHVGSVRRLLEWVRFGEMGSLP